MRALWKIWVFLITMAMAAMPMAASHAQSGHAGHGAAAASAAPVAASAADTSVTMMPDVTISLRTAIAGGKLVFIGHTGAIADVVNPDLKVPEGAVVQINLINDDGAGHDIAVPEFNAKSDVISGKGSATAIVFRANKSGVFEYLCTLPGHKAAGMVGKIIVG